MNTIYKTQQELVASVAGKIDKTSFRQCYLRRDPSITFFAVISPEEDMAGVVAHLLEGSKEPLSLDQLIDKGLIRAIPPREQLLYACQTEGLAQQAEVLQRFVEARMGDEVRAFYCSPGYFVQFTGRTWK